MQGRNGVDQFARFTMGVALAAIAVSYTHLTLPTIA